MVSVGLFAWLPAATRWATAGDWGLLAWLFGALTVGTAVAIGRRQRTGHHPTTKGLFAFAVLVAATGLFDVLGVTSPVVDFLVQAAAVGFLAGALLAFLIARRSGSSRWLGFGV